MHVSRVYVKHTRDVYAVAFQAHALPEPIHPLGEGSARRKFPVLGPPRKFFHFLKPRNSLKPLKPPLTPPTKYSQLRIFKPQPKRKSVYMAYPPTFVPSQDYSDFETAHPNSPKPGASLDTDFNNAALSINQLRSFSQIIQNADGTLKSGIVGLDQIQLGLTPEEIIGAALLAAVTEQTEIATEKAAEAFDSEESAASSASSASASAASASTSAATALEAASLDGVFVTLDPYNADPTGVNDSAAAFQQAHDDLLDAMLAANSNIPSGVVLIPTGRYKLNSGITQYPGIKFRSKGGPVYIDMSRIADGVTGWRVDGSLWTDTPSSTSPGMAAALRGPFLDGAEGGIYVNGKSTDATSVGLDVGNSSSMPDYGGFRHCSARNVHFENFGTCLKLRSLDTYLLSFYDCYFSKFRVAGLTTDGTVAQQNSGENIRFVNTHFAQGSTADAVAILLQTPGMNMTFDGCSFDFCKAATLRIKAGVQTPSFQYMTFNDCWFEASNDVALVESQLISNPTHLRVTINDGKWVARRNSTATPDYDGPVDAAFKGRFTLQVNGLQIGGFDDPAMNADDGNWMCDSLVSVDGFTFSFAGWRQMPARSQVINRNYNFNEGTTGATGRNIPGWYVGNTAAISAELSNTEVFDGSANSVKFTASNATNFYVMYSDPYPVPTGKTVYANPVAYGGTSTGLMRIQCQHQLLRPKNRSSRTVASLQRISTSSAVAVVFLTAPHRLVAGDIVTFEGANQSEYNISALVRAKTDTTKVPPTIVSITRSGSDVTVTTATDHGLVQYDTIQIAGATEMDYNGYKIVNGIPTSKTFTFKIATTPSTPATGTPSYTMVEGFWYVVEGNPAILATGTISYTPWQFEVVSTTSATGSDFKDLYENTDDPDYDAGNRTMWAKEKQMPATTNRTAGCTHGRLIVTTSNLANGDVIYLGAVPIVIGN